MAHGKAERKPTLDEGDAIEKALAEYSRAAVSLAKLLQENPNLSDLQRLSVENNLAIVQLNYTYWMRQAHKFHSV
jgi:hypothetical protein